MSKLQMLRPLLNLVLSMALGPFSLRGQGLPPAIPAAKNTPDGPAKLAPQEPAGTSLEEARQLSWNGDYKRAAARFTQIIAGGTDVAAAYAGLAQAYLKLHKVDEAYKAATKAAELEPSSAAAHAALGEVYFRQGKLYEAEQEFLTPLRARNENARAYFGLARIYHTTFNEQRAKTVLDKAHALDPKDPEINGDWVLTRSAAEQIGYLDAFIGAGGHGEHIGRAGARQMLAMLKDQAQHPERTCQMVNKVHEAQMSLEPLFSASRGSFDRAYPGVGLDARLNGYSTRLVVETSGDRILLNQKTAEKAGAQQIVRTEIEGVGDENPPEGYTAYVESIRFGEVELKGCYVTVLEDASPNNFLGSFEGAIGAGIFGDFLVDLDLRRSKLKLTELPPYPQSIAGDGAAKENGSEPPPVHDRYVGPEMADWIPLYRSSRLLLLPTNVNGSEARMFGISMGSGISVISEEAAREVSTVTTDQFTHVRGLNGAVKNGRKSGYLKLEFAGLRFEVTGLPVVDMSLYSENSFEVAGLLGFPVLRDLEIRIDYRDGLISFDHPDKRK